MSVAHRLLRIASVHDTAVVGSDTFADVLPPASVRLAALDQLERVIYAGTFAKTLSASQRSGYVAAHRSVIDALCDLKMLTTVNSSGYIERIIHDLITSGQYRRHLKRLAKRIEEAASRAGERIRELNLSVLGSPAGGFICGASCPRSSATQTFPVRPLSAAFFWLRASVFYPDQDAHCPVMRVNVAYVDDPRFRRFMENVLGWAHHP